MANLSPPENGNLRSILIDSYSESSGRPSDNSGRAKWQIYPPRNGNFRFILIDSYSESSGRPGRRIHQVPDLPPPREWQFEIHTDRFLLQELRQTR